MQKLTITYQRDKCIGCNYCVENAPMHWAMSRIDGRSVLLGSTNKKGRWSLRISPDERERNEKAAKSCPVKAIQVNG